VTKLNFLCFTFWLTLHVCSVELGSLIVFTFMSNGRTGQSMFDKIKEKIPVLQNKCGAAVGFQLDPFAVAIVTPVMQRAHSADFASNICFVDLTAFCDADNHVLTFFLTLTVAGAVPLGVVITDSTSTASYTAGFMLLKSVMLCQSFSGHGRPLVFLTDNSDAGRAALQTCWPDADLKLCFFHVPQAVWQWLYAEQHGIGKDDRQALMAEFQRIVYSCTSPSHAKNVIEL